MVSFLQRYRFSAKFKCWRVRIWPPFLLYFLKCSSVHSDIIIIIISHSSDNILALYTLISMMNWKIYYKSISKMYENVIRQQHFRYHSTIKSEKKFTRIPFFVYWIQNQKRTFNACSALSNDEIQYVPRFLEVVSARTLEKRWIVFSRMRCG